MTSSEREVEQYMRRLAAMHLPALEFDQVLTMLKGAMTGYEVEQCGTVDAWFKDRAGFSTVMLDNSDYITALTQSLRIAPNLAGTDYGTSRQRDLGQLWTDVARGFLGEIGLAKFVKQRFGLELILDYSIGPIAIYLPSDIKGIRLPDGREIQSALRISFKTTKLNGIWLDVPGAQINHSDAFVLVKLGISRDHFVAFLKGISFIRDKLLPAAMKTGTIDDKGAEVLWNTLPDFKQIPCYTVGFMDRELINAPPSADYRPMRRRNGALKGYFMKRYVGWVREGKPVGVADETRDEAWEFQSIGSFSKEDHFVATSGCLRYSEADWRTLLDKATTGNLL